MNYQRILVVFALSIFALMSCSDGSSEEFDSEENRLEKEKNEPKDDQSEVSEEKMKELEDLESTNDSLKQIDAELDEFIESLNE